VFKAGEETHFSLFCHVLVCARGLGIRLDRTLTKEHSSMTEENPAEMRSLKRMDKLETANDVRRKKRPSPLSLLHATLIFVGGLGRVLKLIDHIVDWWNSLY
jgi:hypothetical protein